MLTSFIRIQNLILSDIYLEKKELISIANSNFSMINSSLNNIFGSRKLYLMNVINSRIITNFITAENLSQTFLYSTKSTVLVERMNFIGNKNHTISAIYSDNNKMLTVNDSVFLKFCSSRGGAILNVNTVFNLSWTLFAENEADDGGGIFTSNSIVYFNQNQFHSNQAQYGAGAYFYSDYDVDLLLINNVFSNGYASYGGGGFYSVFMIPDSINDTFFNNSALYGNDFATPPIVLSLNISDTYLRNYQPSSFLPDIAFILKDFYDNTVKGDLNGKATITFADQTIYIKNNLFDQSKQSNQLEGQILDDYNNNSFVFSNLKINFKPESTIILIIYTNLPQHFLKDSYQYNFPHYLDTHGNYYYLLEINSTECPMGSKNLFLFFSFFNKYFNFRI